jgi:hypothetical protein
MVCQIMLTFPQYLPRGADLITDEMPQGRHHSELITEMLRTHSLDPFKRILGMSDDEYERVVKNAQSELAERGESARIYIKVSVLPNPPKILFSDCGPGILYTDKSRHGRVFQALRARHHVENDNNKPLAYVFRIDVQACVRVRRLHRSTDWTPTRSLKAFRTRRRQRIETASETIGS